MGTLIMSRVKYNTLVQSLVSSAYHSFLPSFYILLAFAKLGYKAMHTVLSSGTVALKSYGKKLLGTVLTSFLGLWGMHICTSKTQNYICLLRLPHKGTLKCCPNYLELVEIGSGFLCFISSGLCHFCIIRLKYCIITSLLI